MSAANWMVLGMGIQCVIAACLYALDKQWPHALMFLGYSIANGGILWAATRLS